MTATSPRQRLFVTAPLGLDREVVLDERPAHYLRNVLRLREGDVVALFNGHDGEWSASIASYGKKRAVLQAMTLRRAQPAAPELRLLYAPLKRGPGDLLVQKATELGVGVLQPVLTRRSQAERLNLARLQAIAAEAAEQCGRLELPEIREPCTLETVLAGWPAARPLLYCDEAGGGAPIAEAAADAPLDVLVGPEGGFDPAERERLAALPLVRGVSLGPRILRAETAAVAALAVLQAVGGDWRK